MKQTPTPWIAVRTTVRGGFQNPEDSGDLICTTDPFRLPEYGKQNVANAAHIVKCVNAHDELVAALKLAEQALRDHVQYGEDEDLENVAHAACKDVLAKLEGGSK
jgi:hypothetical protein